MVLWMDIQQLEDVATPPGRVRAQAPFEHTLRAMILVALVLAAQSMDTKAAHWQDDVVVVYDHTAGRRWGPIIADQVEALNAALPRGAPRFVYRDAGKKGCEEIERTRQVISVCSMKRLSRPAAASVTRRGETIHEALILLRQRDIRLGHHRVCHELMHAVTAIPDAYRTEPESCVRGERGAFGAWDIALLDSEYGDGEAARRQEPTADSR